MKLILLGAPGAGKGTQAEILSKMLNIPTISTGNILRAAMKNGTPVGLRAKEYVESGKLVPDEVIIERMSGRRTCKDCSQTFHIVSNPPKVEGKCDFCGGELIQRADDNLETVTNRIDVYEAQTMPLIDYYEKAGNLVHIDGSTGLENVFADIVSALGE